MAPMEIIKLWHVWIDMHTDTSLVFVIGRVKDGGTTKDLVGRQHKFKMIYLNSLRQSNPQDAV